mgnify:CR=1 FL=1
METLPKMAKFMFADNSLREAVNGIVHPAVQTEVLNQVEKERGLHKIEYFFFEAALLIECGYGKLVDEMWYVFDTVEIREKRLMESRGYSKERIANMIACQRSDESFRANCDFVIDNSGSPQETLEQLRTYIKSKGD